MQWNCRSIFQNECYLSEYLSKNNHQVLLLQSLNVHHEKLPFLNGYYYPPLYHAEESGKVSTAIYIQFGINYDKLQSPVPVICSDISAVGAKILINGYVTNVLSVYFKTGPSNSNSDWLQALGKDNDHWIIGGDFNAHSPLWEKNCQVVTNSHFVDNVIESSLILMNDGSITRVPDIPNHKATSIDLTLVSPNLAIISTWHVEDDSIGSDHLPVILKFNNELHSKELEADIIPRFIYDQADWSTFQNYLSAQNVDDFEHDNVDIFYNKFCEVVIKAAELSIPKRNSNYKGKHKGNVWWNSTCAEAVKNKKLTYKKWLKDKIKIDQIDMINDQHLEKDALAKSYEEMRKAKNFCNRVISQAKKDYWNNYCAKEISDHRDTKKIWKKVKDMANGVSLPQYPIKVQDKELPTSFEKAEVFVNMFANTCSKDGLNAKELSHRVNAELNEQYEDPFPNNENFINSPLTFDEVENAIKSFGCKKVAVGYDAISYSMLSHLPKRWVGLLHQLFLKCWESGVLPSVWKKSIITPILKPSKPRYDPSSYRPISLTSHVGKVMEKIVLKRLTYYCDKNKIIPNVQAGFRKGRSTIDHLVKLSTNIKRQFAKRKSVLATFFDVQKAYDRIWHPRLLFKLKNIGLNGNSYNYIKSLLVDRCIITKVGNSLSSPRIVDMGIPQGSIIAPLLFNIMLYDLPKHLSKTITVVQYADDIAIWMNVKLKKKTGLHYINHVSKLYQSELNKLNMYMKENGLQFSAEKTSMILFNNGAAPSKLPIFYLNGQKINYKSEVKFLGLYFTQKLNWKKHIEEISSKALKSLNLLKMVSHQPWGQDSKILVHLATSLIRSRLTYGQEVFFSAPKTYLKKLQSIDSRAIKLALGVPVHAHTLETYKLVGLLPLDEYRKLASAKYVVRANASENSVKDELFIQSDKIFPKRAKNNKNLETIATYVSDIFVKTNVNPENVAQAMSCSPIPSWELLNAGFDIDHTDIKKEENTNMLATNAKMHLAESYPNHLKVYTDGSVLDDDSAGSGFIIPSLNVKKSYHLGRGFSIFTAELISILMALTYLMAFPINIFNILFCVDSKSVLKSLRSSTNKINDTIIFEIKFLIHCLKMRGTDIDMCWIPSHSGFKYNECADFLAKVGAKNRFNTEKLFVRLSTFEMCNLIEKSVSKPFMNSYKNTSSLLNVKGCNRAVKSIAFRLLVNAPKTKYCKDVKCICSSNFSVEHILTDCNYVKKYLPLCVVNSVLPVSNVNDFWKCFFEHNFSVLCLANHLYDSPVGQYL